MPIWKIAGSLVAFFGLALLYALEIQSWNLHLDRNRLIVIGLVGGAALGIFLLLAVRSKLPEDWENRIRLILGMFLLALLMGPLLLSLTNRWFSPPPESVEIEFLREDPRYSSRFGVFAGERVEPSSYFSYFYYKNQLYRISHPSPLFEGVAANTKDSIALRHGAWGFGQFVP